MKLFEKVKIDYKNNHEREIRFLNFPIIQYGKIEENDIQETYLEILPFLNSSKKLEQFWQSILNQINHKHDQIFIMRVPALGEAYLFNFLIDELINKYKAKNPCIVFYSKKQSDVFKLFSQIPFYQINIDIDILKFYVRDLHYKYNHHTFHIFQCSHYIATRIMKKICKNNYVNNYPAIIKNLWQVSKYSEKKYVFPEDVKNSLNEKIKSFNLNINKFIFIIPQANGILPYNEIFWQELVSSFFKKGYDCFVNTENGLCSYGKSLQLSISEAVLLASKAKGIVALRCGLLELLSNLNIPKHILYTNEKHFNISPSRMIDIYSLKNYPMVNSNTVAEYDTSVISHQNIIDKIVEEFL